MSFNLATMLRESADAAPSAPLLFAGDAELDYRTVDAESGRLAAGLIAAGLAPGDKVAVQLPNLPQFVVAYFGILKAGLTMVPLNPLFTAREVEYHLTDSDARLFITSAFSLAGALEGARAADVSDVVVVGGEPPAGARDFSALLGEDTGEIHPTNADNTCLLYTSPSPRD